MDRVNVCCLGEVSAGVVAPLTLQASPFIQLGRGQWSVLGAMSAPSPASSPRQGRGVGRGRGCRGVGRGAGGQEMLADPCLSLFLLSGQYSPGRVTPAVTVSCSWRLGVEVLGLGRS